MNDLVAVSVFTATLALTFGVAIYSRMVASGAHGEEELANRNLNKWLVGLSAATTGNSGFIVTGAVGIGYTGGAQWLLLPIGWLIGDLIFWSIFPARINALGRRAKAVTVSELLTFDLHGSCAWILSTTVAIVLVGLLALYTAAQWLSGEKFLSSIMPISDLAALSAFGATIVLYSAIGGFRGSVYVDTLQAVIRVAGTVIAVWSVVAVAMVSPGFSSNIAAAGPGFLNPFVNGSGAVAGMLIGYGFAAIGFGLGQPQIVSRYMSGASPEETKAARWIYISFLQLTWLAMTGFGIILRGIEPNLADPEKGLSLFFQSNLSAVATGIIFADVFATIASTSNGLLVAMSQALRRDVLARWIGARASSPGVSTAVTLVLGLGTILLSFWLPGTVFSIAITAVSLIGASLAGAVMIKLFAWPHSAGSLLASVIGGFFAGTAWHAAGFTATLNEAPVGIAVSLLINRALARR